MTSSTNNILDLPAELLVLIVRFLEDEDVFTLRIVSRTVEQTVFKYFAKRFFRKKGFMITTPSLDVLQQISQQDQLKPYVQHVWFNPDCYTYVEPDCAPEAVDDDTGWRRHRRPEDEAKYKAYLSCHSDHIRLLRKPSKGLENLLTTALQQLPNLKIIGMRRSEDHKPWGWRTLKDSIGEDPRVTGPTPSGPQYSLSGPTLLFLFLVRAVAASNIVIRRFYTDAIELDNIRPAQLPQDLLSKACSSIWYLEINITKAWLANSDNHVLCDTLDDPASYGRGLISLLRATTNLKELGLQLFPDQRSLRTHNLAYQHPSDWQKTYPYLCFTALALNVQLVHLTRIKLERIITRSDTLISFLIPSAPHLTSLKLRDIRLLSHSNFREPWRKFLTFLLDSCPQLKYMFFYRLLHSRGGISFLENPPLPLPLSETDPTTGAPNPSFSEGEETDAQEFFLKYEHIALRASGREEVRRKLEVVRERHWYLKPIMGYQLDEDLWHTDTSDEEW
ncbi:hypothetical protein BAUCODRAFT_435168 [Baudoinia panamericana UAMH 10762]|uniref:F-box domain-containing protein n=1 Tax=Baudoinia panamericana (strain UAMH 10762) TaxID=717646 RepID=M2NCT9_BAUPA|nr:uncharacterized protein BAUCODRAFT_435168 [Baudoinia panamericana UAMH 10762]EMC96994.1 hypothetical protein BAUCODRAFT_435168 [Baudoinia panamericana UAMH 10762]